METLNVAATHVVARPSLSRDLGAVTAAPHDEPHIEYWPVWVRLLVLIGGSAALWAGIGWIAFRILKLG